MDIGMLWYDESDKTLAQKVVEAAEYYKDKHGVTPTVCYVHPKMLDKDGERIVGKVTIHPMRMMMVNHIWIGVAETPPKKREANRLVAGALRRRK